MASTGTSSMFTVGTQGTFGTNTNSTINTKLETSALEKQVKFCQERASHVERNYGILCQTLGSITRKMARLRDKGDMLSKQLLEFADREKTSMSTSKHIKDFAHNLAAVQDYRDAEIHRLEGKVVKPLSVYGGKCKTIKQVIKREQGAIGNEVKQRKKMEKVKEKNADPLSIAETEHQKAVNDAAIGSEALTKQMRDFEKEKLLDLKRVLADFVSVELVFHAKAIEYYSKCFENLANIDEEADLEEFSRKLNITKGHTGPLIAPDMSIPEHTLGSTVKSNTTMASTGTSDYTSTGDSYTYTYTYGEGSTMDSTDKRVRIQNQSNMYGADDDDDEDDDDSDDDDEQQYQAYSRPAIRH